MRTKRLLLMLVSTACCLMSASAQDDITINTGEKIETKVSARANIGRLTVKSTLDNNEIKMLRQRVNDEGTTIRVIDLSGATFADDKDDPENNNWGTYKDKQGTTYYCQTEKNAIPAQMFMGFSALEEVILPAGTTQIFTQAFEDCPNLTKVHLSGSTADVELPSGLQKLGTYAFHNSGITGKVTIPAGTAEITQGVFEGCTGITEVSIENTTITSFDSNAFCGCTSLKAINFPASLTTIETNCFNGCTALPGLDLPSGLVTIETQAFEGCTSITHVKLPDGMTRLEGEVFKNCTSLSDFSWPDQNKIVYIGYEALRNTAISSISIPNTVTVMGHHAFSGCNITEITFNPTCQLTEIAYGAFSNNPLTGTVTIPASIKKINNWAFGCNEDGNTVNNTTLTAIAFESDQVLESIGEVAFANLHGLTAVSLPNSTKDIMNNAFIGCEHITSLSMPINADMRIGNTAFANSPLTTLSLKLNSSDLSSVKCPYNFSADADNTSVYGTDKSGQLTIENNPFESAPVNACCVEFSLASGVNETEAVGDIRSIATFRRLLTKIMNEEFTATTENQGVTGNMVVAQKHADVIIKRSIKTKWNTMVLPFDVTAAQFAETLGEDALAAYYTELMEGGKTLLFTTRNDDDDLPMGKPFIFEAESRRNTTNHLSDETAAEPTTTTMDTPYSIENKWIKFMDVETISEPAIDHYTGKDGLFKAQGVFDKTGAIATNNTYFIRDNAWYRDSQVKSVNTVGFRAWFDYVGTGEAPAKTLSLTASDFGDITTIGLPTDTQAEKGVIYNLNGQKVGNGSEQHLRKGIYIVNGKKIVIK